ncbi:hypothetical protein CWI84_02185 [Idiomarina tyrosinivorans]|uniref:AAA family ATPase n=1 Tax=Idiomarina tyrosinivorans TaxID=1445662 RepID=A0A432ZSU0_9GAMM|nr:SbcC/MukB-like Walker B domain-containing protein [Idiomarina tyrosinivorans]RUO80943.1 hypothetical protein CWI84_02185 [Idiomarina tyrosinivorans]
MSAEVTKRMHTLTHITLVNWYLFTDVTIPADEGCILIRGFNGVGKSSLADAIQVVLAGADETKKNLTLNAASSNDGKTGRSIRSYCLGIVSDTDGEDYVPTRESSNTYIALAFKRPNGTEYSIGIHLYCRKSESGVVQKHRFTVEGAPLTSTDFMEGEYTVLPWKDMEHRLANTINGKASFFRTAQDFRMKYCELMSYEVADHQISPDMMLQAFKNGISFKEQKSIDEFTRDYILPRRNIDVMRIENDYEEYAKIEKLITGAKEKLESLYAIIKHYKRYQLKSQQKIAFDWSVKEADKGKCNSEIEAAQELIEALSKGIEQNEQKLALLETKLPKLEKARDSSKSAFDNSEPKKLLDQIENQLSVLTIEDKQFVKQGNKLKEDISALCSGKFSFPSELDPSLSQAFDQGNQVLMPLDNCSQDDLLSPWFLEEKTPSILSAFLRLKESVKNSIEQGFDEAKQYHESLQSEFTELTEAYKKASEGKATLRDTTKHMIMLLKDSNIEAIPVCELATITDTEWQKGIEHFLGSNRESLVIQADKFEAALKVYRAAKDAIPKLRQVKLVNPDKNIWPNVEPDERTAANLIQSNHPVAKRYLQGLLFKVFLVDTESELREAKRAITKDGMVAGNGAIGGGNRVDFVLIGKDARRQDALRIQERASELAPKLQSASNRQNAIKSFKVEYEQTTMRIQDLWDEISCSLDEFRKRRIKINALKVRQKEIEESSDDTLKAQFKDAEKELKELREEQRELELGIQRDKTIKEQKEESLQTLNEQFTIISNEQHAVENSPWYEAQLASDIYESLVDEHGSEIEALIAAQKNAKNADNAANKAKGEGKELLVEYCTRYEPVDKKELLAMDELSQLARCQAYADRIQNIDIVIHEDEAKTAREKMLENFRAEVVAKLKESFQEIDYTFDVLNSQLSGLTFNDNTYYFKHPVTRIESLKEIHDYITDTSDLSEHDIGGLFDEDKDSPAIESIQNLLLDNRLHEISDYRNFYTYDIIEKNSRSGEARSVSKLLSTGSGGEKQTPFYVALGASFMSAYRIKRIGNHIHGGAALAVFDEAFSKMDGNNAQSALAFFRDIGLQVILVAPPEIDLKSGRFADKIYNVLRDGNRIYLDSKSYTSEGKDLLDSDNPYLHSEIMNDYIAQVREDIGIE